MMNLLFFSLLANAQAAAPPDLTGTWKLDLVVATRVVVPVIGGLANWTTTTMLVTIEARPEGLMQTQKVCAIQIGSRPHLASSVIPPAFVRSIPVRTFPIFLSQTTTGWNSLADPGPLAVGFDPRQGPIPVDGDPQGSLDFEGDGKPGATVQVEVPLVGLQGDVWVVQHGHTIMQGTDVRSDYVRGKATVVFLEQHTIGATHPWLMSSPKVTQDPGNSYFEMRRVPEGSGC